MGTIDDILPNIILNRESMEIFENRQMVINYLRAISELPTDNLHRVRGILSATHDIIKHDSPVIDDELLEKLYQFSLEAVIYIYNLNSSPTTRLLASRFESEAGHFSYTQFERSEKAGSPDWDKVKSAGLHFQRSIILVQGTNQKHLAHCHLYLGHVYKEFAVKYCDSKQRVEIYGREAVSHYEQAIAYYKLNRSRSSVKSLRGAEKQMDYVKKYFGFDKEENPELAEIDYDWKQGWKRLDRKRKNKKEKGKYR